MQTRLVVVTCEHYAPELDAALAASGASGLERACFDCRCGRAPLTWEDIPGALGGDADAITHVFGAACLGRVAREAPRYARIQLHRLRDCHELIASRAALEALVARGGYVITSRWLRSWRRRLEALGMADEASRRILTETCSALVLLDAGVEPRATAELAELSEALSLPGEVVVTGNEILEGRLRELRLARDLGDAQAAVADASSQAADFAVALAVFAHIGGAETEAEAVEGIFRLFDALCAPGAMAFVPVVGGVEGAPVRRPPDAAALRSLAAPADEYEATEGGFSVAIRAGRARAGVLHVRAIAHAPHRDRYLNFALAVVSVCGMALEKARQRERLVAAERSLSREKERLATTLRSIGDGVLATDAAGRVLFLNEVAERLTGWSQSEAMGCGWREVLRLVQTDAGSPEGSLVRRVLERGEPVTLGVGVQIERRDGGVRAIAGSAAPILTPQGPSGVVIAFRDVTDAERVERQLQRIERLESLGVFAGGLAHDFNNMLMAMMTNLAIAREEAPADSELATCVDEALRAATRAEGLTRQLLTFAKGGAPVKVSAPVEDLVRESVSLPLRGTNVRAEYDLELGLWPVDADPGQLGQVIRNLVINAVQAMPRGGVLRIECRNVEPAELAGLPLPSRRFVRLALRDQGSGIAPESLARIFDPFFTTKKQGNGLGLSVVHSIVRRHAGHVEVESVLGSGTTFRVWVPASASMPASAPRGSAVPSRGDGRILLMDDDEAVRRVTERVLVRLGYAVVTARDGEDAVQAYRAALLSGARYDLVILDLTVPGAMGGLEAIELLRALDPGVRAVAASGYANAPVMAECAKFGFAAALAKPYESGRLSEVVSQLLEA